MSNKPTLNMAYLQEKSRNLHDLLRSYSVTQKDAELCLRALQPIFEQVSKGLITEPYKQPPPCGYYFVEGSLRAFPVLESAYAEFSMALQGWDTASLDSLLESALRKHEK